MEKDKDNKQTAKVFDLTTRCSNVLNGETLDIVLPTVVTLLSKVVYSTGSKEKAKAVVQEIKNHLDTLIETFYKPE